MKKSFDYNTMSDYQLKAYNRLINNNSQACSKDKIPQGFGDFGLVKTNPIPVHGVFDIETYLSKLSLNNGNKIQWQRISNVNSKNIKELVERYKIYKPNDNFITILYFSPYHLRTSSKAPKGFKIK